MLRRVLLLVALALLFASSAVAQAVQALPPGAFLGRGAIDPIAGPIYTGPGDVVSGATAWYGTRAYNASNLNGTTKAYNLVRFDSTACDFDIATTGGMGNSDAGCSLGGGITPVAFATTDATATCTMTSAATTAICTGASSTPHVNSQITAAGLSQPCYVSAVGTFTGGAGTITVNNTEVSCALGGNVTSVTFAFTYALFIAKAYDLTGNGHTLLQATPGVQWRFLPNCSGALPCTFANAFDPDFMKATVTAVSDPLTVSAVALRPGNIGGKQTIFAFQGGTGFAVVGFGNGTSLSTIGEASDFNVSGVTDGVMHAFQYIPNGASSSIDVDCTITTGSTTTGQTGATTLTAGAESNGSSVPLYAIVFEQGYYSTGRSTTDQGLLTHNQRLYYGTGGSC